MRKIGLALALGALALIGLGRPPARRRSGAPARPSSPPRRSHQLDQRRATRASGRSRARAYRARRIGFYSYSYRDVINTYGMSRAKYGSINSYRDPFLDRQTVNGPFDHGFFFNSAIAPRGGNAPYLH